MRIIALLFSCLVSSVALCSPSIGTLNFEYIFNGDTASEDDVVTALSADVDSLGPEDLHIFSFEEKGHHYVTFATSMKNYAKLKESVDLEWVKNSMLRQGIDSVEIRTPRNLKQEVFELEEGSLNINPDFVILIVRPFRKDFEEDLETFLIAYLKVDAFSFNIATNPCCLCVELEGVNDKLDFFAKFNFGKLLKQTSEVYVYAQE